MLLRSDPRITSALTTDVSALTLLNQLHTEIMTTLDPNVVSTSLGQYTAIAAARVARRAVAPLRSAVSTQYEEYVQMQTTSLRLQMSMDRTSKLMSTLSNLLKKASEEANAITQNIK